MFEFRTLFRGREGTRWRFTFEPSGNGTLVTERWIEPDHPSVPIAVRLMFRVPVLRRRRCEQISLGMAETLSRIKTAAERSDQGVLGS